MKYTTKINNWIKENTKRSVTRTKSKNNIISNYTGNLKPKGLVKYKDGVPYIVIEATDNQENDKQDTDQLQIKPIPFTHSQEDKKLEAKLQHWRKLIRHLEKLRKTESEKETGPQMEKLVKNFKNVAVQFGKRNRNKREVTDFKAQFTTNRDSKLAAFHWRLEIESEMSTRIWNMCKNQMDLLGYLPTGNVLNENSTVITKLPFT